MIDTPTRITAVSRSCLDLMFCDSPGYILNSEVVSPIAGSDHSTIIASVDFSIVTGRDRTIKRLWKFARTDIPALNNAIREFRWEDILDIDNVNDMTVSFTEALMNIFQAHIPYTDRWVKASDAPWFNGELKRAVNRRNKAYGKLVKHDNIANYNKFKDEAKLVTDLVAKRKCDYKNKLCVSLNSHSSGSKNYWVVMKRLLGKKFCSDIPPLEINNDVAQTDFEL